MKELLFNGWGFQGSLWQDVMSEEAEVISFFQQSPQALLKGTEVFEAQRVSAWSLGAFVCLDLIRQSRLKTKQLRLYSPAWSFVKTETNESGWAPRVLQRMKQLFEKYPLKVHEDFVKRASESETGKTEMAKELLPAERDILSAKEVLALGLDFLAGFKMSESEENHVKEYLSKRDELKLFAGIGDQIVSVQASRNFAQSLACPLNERDASHLALVLH